MYAKDSSKSGQMKVFFVCFDRARDRYRLPTETCKDYYLVKGLTYKKFQLALSDHLQKEKKNSLLIKVLKFVIYDYNVTT